MKRRNILISIVVLVVVLCSVLFTACGPKSAQLIPKGREVESVKILYRASYDAEPVEYKLSGDDLKTFIEKMKDQGALERKYARLSHTEEYWKYTIEITLKKKGLKKAMSYTLEVGYYYTTTNIIDKRPMLAKDENRMNLYYKDNWFKKDCSGDFLIFLQKIVGIYIESGI